MTVVVYGGLMKHCLHCPHTCGKTWEEQVPCVGGEVGGDLTSPLHFFLPAQLQHVPTAPPPLQTLWLITAKHKLKYWRTCTHHYSPGKTFPASRWGSLV